ncbi:hypothetical protein BN7_6564 [Wickerhamomyces ciferrii]|uniref:Nuclear control of ATPase protein 2 n=1 Tax=Wickerhamomyces ciferrii (strain ATCC 14091 / BCRC 22168 / CBS 111 / JCM 3599 / NBRC 0793 / NRRL Y-1031 F-60-10) TaxID=1206466 RepID=K0L0J5_WICCF|nr:uncharacterized protein BN7_6564 [Wickerhamomyces ciferrii]CCH46958.1 hypothetical protein BN7_6564 [Wickerhamomyces ciferrii]
MSTGVINDAFQDNLVFLEKYSNSILDEITELHINDADDEINNSINQLSNNDQIRSQLLVIQSSYQDISNIVLNLKKKSSNINAQGSKDIDLNNKNVKLVEILKILKPFSQGSIYEKIKSQLDINSIDTLAIKEIELIGKLEKTIIYYAIISLYQLILTQYLQNTIPLNDDLFYYDLIINSNWNVFLYSLQTLPSRGSTLVKSILNDFKKTTTPNISSLDIQVPEYLVSNYPNYINSYKLFIHYKNILTNSIYNNFVSQNIKGFYKILNQNKNGFNFQKSSLSIKNYFSIILGTPINLITQELTLKKSNLLSLQSENAKKLGFLIKNIPNMEKLSQNENDLGENIQSLVSVFPKNVIQSDLTTKSNDHFINLYQISNKIIPQSKHSIQQLRSLNSKPSFITRYWPTILLTGVYGPSTILSIITNKDQILEFIQKNLIDTVKGFLNNWILKPVKNILSTIRHDDNSEISIMSQKSLDSDLNSLKRMVIEYTLENSPEYKNLKSTDLEILKTQLDQLVSNGDLTPLMKDYENDIKQPLKNLIKGKLTRALLIQIQKTKVDGAVAISGIDKLLKSQELVFGIVAASPSLIILIYFIKGLNSYLQKGYITRNSNEYKLIVSKNLNNIERLLNKEFDNNNQEELNYINGMLLLEIISLRNSGISIIPKNRRFEWIRDVNDLNNQNSSILVKLNTIQRIHNIYNQFIN